MRHLTALLVALPLAVSPALAEDDTDTLMKNAAITGALLSWGAVTLWGDRPADAALSIGPKRHVGVSVGQDAQSGLAGIMAGWDFGHNLIDRHSWRLRGQWEVDLSGWWADHRRRRNQSGVMLGLTPVLQYEYRSAYRPYVEFGIGARYLSDTHLADYDKSTQFQFGDLMGFGVSLRDLQVGFRFLHISNAGIETPNPGTNYYSIKLDYAF